MIGSGIGLGLRLGIGIGISGQGGGKTPSLLDAFASYLNPMGADEVFSDSDVISEAKGALKGTFTINDDSTGVIQILNEHLKIDGDRVSYETTYLYGDEITRVPGKTVFIKLKYDNLTLSRSRFGLCKSDFSNISTQDLAIYMNYTGIDLCSDSNIGLGGTTYYGDRGAYTELEFIFLLGGFDSSGNPYNGIGDLENFTYGGYIFLRGERTPVMRLLKVSDKNNNLNLRPNISGYEDRGDERITKIATVDKINILPTISTYMVETDENVINNTLKSFMIHCYITTVASSVMNIKLCLDDENTPTNYIEIALERDGNMFVTITEYINSIPNELRARYEFGYLTTYPFEIFIEKGKLSVIVRSVSVYNGVINTIFDDYTKILVTGDVGNKLTQFKLYPTGKERDYDEYLPKFPYLEGNNPPGFNLPGETRKGWHFDVSKIGSHVYTEQTGIIMKLTNGSSVASVKYRDFYRQSYIDDLSFSVDLDYAYTGDTKTIAIVSDPHYGIGDSSLRNGNAKEAIENIVNTDLLLLGVSEAFILGDLVHDVDLYSELIASLDGTITWYTLPGNHDVLADWKTAFSQTESFYSVDIGNCHFIILGSQNSSNDIGADGEAFLGTQLTNNQDVNCFIMTHAGRYNTTRQTLTGYTQTVADVETAIGSNDFVAWFCGHSHGYAGVKEPDNSVYLNLG